MHSSAVVRGWISAPLSVGIALLAASHAAAQPTTTQVTLYCRSALVAQAHPDNNYGLGQYWIKVGNGFNRMLARCDLSPIAGRADDVVAATYRLRVQDDNFTTDGTDFSLHPFDGTRPDWTEGDDLYDALHYCSKTIYARPNNDAGTPGATWHCPTDTDTHKGHVTAKCPVAEQWDGGFPGHAAQATSSQTFVHSVHPTCSESLDCAAHGGGVDCWRPMDWDVKSDVVAALDAGTETRWLVRRTTELNGGAGGFYAFSEEMAVCVLGVPDLRPELLVTLVERPGDPPSVPDPLADGVRCALVNGN